MARYTSSMHTLVSHVMLVLASISLIAQSAAGVKWTVPAGWKTEAGRPLRAATYTIAAAAGDTATAECGVYFFGAGQGGSIDANLERWRSQVQGPDGKPAAAKIAKRASRGLNITTVDASGAYSGLGGPIASSPRAVPGYRLLAAVVEAPGGNLFVKFAGPAATIAANQQKFEQLLASFQKQN